MSLTGLLLYFTQSIFLLIVITIFPLLQFFTLIELIRIFQPISHLTNRTILVLRIIAIVEEIVFQINRYFNIFSSPLSWYNAVSFIHGLYLLLFFVITIFLMYYWLFKYQTRKSNPKELQFIRQKYNQGKTILFLFLILLLYFAAVQYCQTFITDKIVGIIFYLAFNQIIPVAYYIYMKLYSLLIDIFVKDDYHQVLEKR